MTRPAIWDLAINIVGLLGILALAVPALYASRYGRLLYRLSQMQLQSPDLLESRDRLEEQLQMLRDGWSLRNSMCLVGGTILTALSYVIGILKAFVV